MNSVKKWLKANNKENGELENLDKIAASRVKYTLPGPMTILDCIKDQFYGEDKAREMVDDLIKIINHEISAISSCGGPAQP